MADELTWSHVDYQPGADEFWDRLGGEDWGAIDGVAPGIRVYATWVERPNGRMVVAGICARGSADSPINSDALRSIPIGRLEAAANQVRVAIAQQSLGRVAPLRRPDGQDPEGFYKLVAHHYRWHAAISRRPAVEMAESAGVPVTTVHRWIREARQHGYLPMARQGAAG